MGCAQAPGSLRTSHGCLASPALSGLTGLLLVPGLVAVLWASPYLSSVLWPAKLPRAFPLALFLLPYTPPGLFLPLASVPCPEPSRLPSRSLPSARPLCSAASLPGVIAQNRIHHFLPGLEASWSYRGVTPLCPANCCGVLRWEQGRHGCGS